MNSTLFTFYFRVTRIFPLLGNVATAVVSACVIKQKAKLKFLFTNETMEIVDK